MSAQPWMPLYVADYLGDTPHLSMHESGCYLHLLMMMWVRGGTIPNDDREIARALRMTGGQWRKVKPKLLPFFIEEGANLTNSRLKIEILRASSIRKKQIENGQLGGRPTKENSDLAKAKGSLGDNPNESIARASSTTTVTEDTSGRDAAAPPSPEPDDPKRAFWRECTAELMTLLPHKSEQACRAILGRCLQAAGSDAEQVLRAVKAASFEQPADPVPWLLARLKPPDRSPSRKPSMQQGMIDALAAYKGQ